MKRLDRVLQQWRSAQATKFIAPNSRVLDLACADGALFLQLGDRISEGIGIDEWMKQVREERSYEAFAIRGDLTLLTARSSGQGMCSRCHRLLLQGAEVEVRISILAGGFWRFFISILGMRRK
jgi:hypothetical protein